MLSGKAAISAKEPCHLLNFNKGSAPTIAVSNHEHRGPEQVCEPAWPWPSAIAQAISQGQAESRQAQEGQQCAILTQKSQVSRLHYIKKTTILTSGLIANKPTLSPGASLRIRRIHGVGRWRYQASRLPIAIVVVSAIVSVSQVDSKAVIRLLRFTMSQTVSK